MSVLESLSIRLWVDDQPQAVQVGMDTPSKADLISLTEAWLLVVSPHHHSLVELSKCMWKVQWGNEKQPVTSFQASA